jgi:clathrin heavy chain
MPYVQKSGKPVDFVKVLTGLVPRNPEAGLGLAKMLVTQGMGGASQIEGIAGVFIQNNRIQETTAFLLEALKNNRPEEGHL